MRKVIPLSCPKDSVQLSMEHIFSSYKLSHSPREKCVILANTIVCFFQLVMAFQLNIFTRKVSQAEGMKVDISTRFSYEELSGAINNFSMDHKIGHDDFGFV